MLLSLEMLSFFCHLGGFLSKASKAFIDLFGINSILLFFDTPHLLWSNFGISYNTDLCKSGYICLERCCYNHIFTLFLVSLCHCSSWLSGLCYSENAGVCFYSWCVQGCSPFVSCLTLITSYNKDDCCVNRQIERLHLLMSGLSLPCCKDHRLKILSFSNKNAQDQISREIQVPTLHLKLRKSGNWKILKNHIIFVCFLFLFFPLNCRALCSCEGQGSDNAEKSDCLTQKRGFPWYFPINCLLTQFGFQRGDVISSKFCFFSIKFFDSSLSLWQLWCHIADRRRPCVVCRCKVCACTHWSS